ncbi:IclR family transcriptional regulator [Caldimonas brevitalea]|uniref:IclR family transcriptional regulator n=2 Tax=Caldimonas brevitalea TaxID=413882 RepID=A0A0G3BM86_9BURK|nr:IclR family transcriptional regulator [Caldimonas brevitalea]
MHSSLIGRDSAAPDPLGPGREDDSAIGSPETGDDEMAGAPPKGKVKEDRHFVTALARGLEVLSCFRSSDKMLGNQELARRCGLPKSTVSRLTYTLTKLGFLDYVEESGRYRLGSATLSLGSAMLARMDVRQIARPLMQDLADFSQAMVSLGSRDRLSMIYVENCRSQSALTLSLDVGSRIPLATTAMGRAYLAMCSEAERNDLMDRIRELDELAWPRIHEGIEAAIAQYRELGVCCSFGDWQKDVNAIAVAFRPDGGRSLMAINCGGPAFNLSRDFLLEEVRPRLVALGARLERSVTR